MSALWLLEWQARRWLCMNWRKKKPKTPKHKLDRAREWSRRRRQSMTAAEREALSRYNRAYRRKHRARLTLAARLYQRKNALHIQLRRKGLQRADYDRVIAAQGKTCGICGGPPDGRWRRYNIDHCHKTGRLRGLLCTNCNRGLGHFKDSPRLLELAIKYLRRRR